MLRRKVIIAFAAIVLFLGASETLFGWPWSMDMVFQVYVRSQHQVPIPPPDGVLSIHGEPPMDTATADKTLKNPIAPSEQSLVKGKFLFDNICATCHGTLGRGDGPLVGKFSSPPNLTLAFYAGLSDGFIYGYIRNGGAIMPAQAEALNPEDRWNVINYLRRLQGK